jgi:diacylglycerol kinase (ATP)
MTNPHKGRTGLDRVLHAAVHSWHGLQAAYTGESAFRQEVWLAVVLIPAAFWVADGAHGTALLIASVLLVMIVELLNSAIEATVDRISMEHHELSKRAKDIGSAAVLLALLLCAVIWIPAVWMRLGAP